MCRMTFSFQSSTAVAAAAQGSALPRHPNSMAPSTNALVIPESMVKSSRGNEQLHVIVEQDKDGQYTFRFATYVNGGVWKVNNVDLWWCGYVRAENTRPPKLTAEGVKLLSELIGEATMALALPMPEIKQA